MLRFTGTGLGLILVSVLGTADVAYAQLEILLEGGDPALGLPGESFTAFDAPILNPSQVMAFEADTSGPSGSDSLYVLDGSQLRLVFAADSVLPGSLEPLRSVSRFRINSEGKVLLEGEDDSPQRGIWVETDGGLVAVALEDQPGPFGTNWNLFPRNAGWADNRLTFEAAVGTPPLRGIWIGEPTDMGIVAQEDAPSPFPGQTYTIGFDTPQLNDIGSLMFGFQSTLSGGILAGPPGEMEVILEWGEAAPGGGFFGVPNIFGFTNRDEACFRALPEDEQGEFFEFGGIYLASKDGVVQLFAGGSGAPGVAQNPPLIMGFQDPVCRDGGVFAFEGELVQEASFPPAGIWAGNADQLGLVAFEGNPAPGLPAGVTFSRVPAGAGPIALNAHGVVAFLANVEGDGINFNNDEGLWAGSPGSIRLIAQIGEDYEIRPGEFRRLTGIEMSASALTDDNRIAVSLEFQGPEVLGFFSIPREAVDPVFNANFELP